MCYYRYMKDMKTFNNVVLTCKSCQGNFEDIKKYKSDRIKIIYNGKCKRCT